MDDTSRGWGLLLGHPRGPHVATSGDFATAMDMRRWVAQAEVDAGTREGVTSAEQEEIRLMPLAEIPQGCSSNFPTLVAVSA